MVAACMSDQDFVGGLISTLDTDQAEGDVRVALSYTGMCDIFCYLFLKSSGFV